MLKCIANPHLLVPDAADAAAQPTEGAQTLADSVMSELNAAASASPPAPSAESSKPEEKPAPAAAAPPKPKPAEQLAPNPAAAQPRTEAGRPTPKASAKPAEEKPVDWKTAPANFRAAHEKLQRTFDTTKSELTSKITSTEQRLQEYASREYLTPEQKQQQQKLQQRLQLLEADLYARDYQQSPEFKAKYEDKAKKVWSAVQAELKGLQVNDKDQQRPATVADFQRVQAEVSSLAAQRRIAREMFGDDADVVLKYVGELRSIEDSANDEIIAKRQGWSNERDASAAKMREQHQTAQRIYSDFDTQLAQKYFQPLEGNKDYNEALDKGLSFVDTNSTVFGRKTIQEQAQVTALIRRMAAAWPAQAVLIKQKDARISDLEAQLSKLQGTDPGAGGEAGGETPAQENGGGTDNMALEIEKLGR